MVYKKYKMGAYNLHTIKTTQFKLCHMEIIFRSNVVKEEITKRNALFDILAESNSTYPTKRDLSLKLEDLYNASLYNVTSKVGNASIANVCMDFISPKYTDKKTLAEALKLPFDMLLNPLVKANEFDGKTLNLVKERLAADIKGVKENPKKYAILEALKTLGADSSSSYGNIGELDALTEITTASLYEYYEKVLKHDYIDIYIIGDLDMNEVKDLVTEYAKFNIIKDSDFKLYVTNPSRKPVVTEQKFIYLQTNVVVLLNLNKLTPYEQSYVANIYNIILGGGSLETKLYKRLRGENSLCYNVGSMYQKYDGLIVIQTAVDVNESEQAIKLIKSAIKDMVHAVSEEELATAKEMLISSLTMGMDNIGKIVDNYFYNDLKVLDDYETRMKEFKKVTLEELAKFSKKVSVSTIYSLVGGGTNE